MDRWRDVAMILLAVSIWILTRPYAGISQDALLYTFQAFSRLRPDTLAGDVFLANVSQDSFTVFPAIHALAIETWGLENSALLLTWLGQAWWFVAAAFIAIRLVGKPMSWLSLGLIAAYPGYYGAFEVFRYAEPFVTSRLFSEALVLTGVALALSERRVLAVLATIAAVAFHPLMGVVGLLVVSATTLGRHGTRLMVVGVIVGLVIAILVAVLRPTGPLRFFDLQWFSLVRTRSPFLVFQDWNADTWATVVRTQALAWLAVSSWRSGSQRDLLTNVVIAGLLGLLITAVGASLAQVVLLTQGQGWRWMWLVQVSAILAAPAAVSAQWAAGPLRRSGLLLLAAGWLLSGLPAIVLTAAAMLALFLPLPRSDSVGRWALLIATAITAVSGLAYLLAYSASPLHAWRTGLLPTLLVFTVWATLNAHQLRLLAAASVAAVVITASLSLGADWGDRRALRSVDLTGFSEWRSAIPVSAEVHWPQHADILWFVLERRSFVSHLQTAGVLFSRDTAMEIYRRTDFSTPSLSAPLVFGDGASGQILRLDAAGVERLCRPGGADYVVTSDLPGFPEAAPAVTAGIERDGATHRYGLVECAVVRSDGDQLPDKRYPEVIG